MIAKARLEDVAWIDQGIVPPLRLPERPDEIAAYLADALGHPVYERWTWVRLIKVYGALPDAKRAKPAVCRLLIDAREVVEAWQRGRLQSLPADQAPAVETVVLAMLKAHGKRFQRAASRPDAADAMPVVADALPGLDDWLRRQGRLVNPHADTNTLGARDDDGALAAFLRERAARSRHTWRAYTAELQRFAQWCKRRGLGPFSDLTRQDLLAYRQWLGQPVIDVAADKERPSAQALSPRSQARALAVVASLYRYWHDTGFLLGNPAAGLSAGGARSRSGFKPTRFVPAPLLKACDDWVACSTPPSPPSSADLARWRRVAVWTLFRCSGVRLAELAWQSAPGLPRLEIDEHGGWTLHVLGKGNRERAVPLPGVCGEVLRSYRLARGLPALPSPPERLPLIHGEKASALGSRGLYDEVKAVLGAVADELETGNSAGAQLLRVLSPHWLRHAYARQLVVDQGVPLPAAQALLGHASVQTTAEYAKTDLSKLRELVERVFSTAA